MLAISKAELVDALAKVPIDTYFIESLDPTLAEAVIATQIYYRRSVGEKYPFPTYRYKEIIKSDIVKAAAEVTFIGEDVLETLPDDHEVTSSDMAKYIIAFLAEYSGGQAKTITSALTKSLPPKKLVFRRLGDNHYRFEARRDPFWFSRVTSFTAMNAL